MKRGVQKASTVDIQTVHSLVHAENHGDMEIMPFDVKEYLEFDVPGSDSVGDWGR